MRRRFEGWLAEAETMLEPVVQPHDESARMLFF
jgi:hypothetical protein